MSDYDMTCPACKDSGSDCLSCGAERSESAPPARKVSELSMEEQMEAAVAAEYAAEAPRETPPFTPTREELAKVLHDAADHMDQDRDVEFGLLINKTSCNDLADAVLRLLAERREGQG